MNGAAADFISTLNHTIIIHLHLASSGALVLLAVTYVRLFSYFENIFTLPTYCLISYEPPHEKTNNLHMQKQRRRSASQ